VPSGALPTLVSTEELARWQAAGPVILLDVRTDVFAYLKGHLPGAEYLNSETLRASEGGIPTRLLSPGAYRALFSRLGVDFSRPVVIYSAGESRNIDATFVAWLLAGLGHARVGILDGGFFKWQLEQRPVVQPYPRIPVTRVPDRPFRPEAASLADVRQGMTRGALLVDARPPDQYAGTAGAQMRHGHIPGAISHYWQDYLTQEGFGHVW
jgi:thiosulfate/3-mercaptopyruvate sulfurtransferase